MHTRSFLPVYLANIFLSLHYAAILYVNSTFLDKFFSPEMVSVLFVLGAVFNILLFLIAPRLLKLWGLKTFYLFFTVATGLSLLGLAFSTSPLKIGLYFIIYLAVQFMVYYCLDIYLEDVSDNQSTGGIRGSYLTLGNAAIAAGPLLLPLLVVGEQLMPVYVAGAIMLVPPLLLGMFFLKLRSTSPHHLPLNLPFRAWWEAESIRRATLARLVLESFYTFMIIYTPIYLHGTLGFQWAELGVIFAIMLLPFVIFEWPMGVLADKLYGEKEIMSLGFFIAGLSLLIMPFLASVFFAWALVLFISRVGASFIEVSTESHFFKQVDARDTSLMSIFRLTRPAGIIVGAVLGAVSLQLFSFEKIFFVFAILIFLGLKESLYLTDTL